MAAEQTAPQDTDAEDRVLGALLWDFAGTAAAVSGILRPEMFYRHRNGALYAACIAAFQDGFDGSVEELRVWIERAGKLGEVGGATRLAELVAMSTSSVNADFMARRVREVWRSREQLRVLQAAVAGVHEGRPPEEIQAEMERELLGQREDASDESGHVVNVADATIAFLDGLASGDEDDPGVPTGMPALGRLMPSRLYILGGYVKHGKTSFALQLAEAAVRGGARVGFCSLEMSRDEVIARLLVQNGAPQSIQHLRVEKQGAMDLSRAASELLRWPGMDVISDPALDVVEVIASYQRLGGYDVLFVDHLHEMHWEDRRDLERAVLGLRQIAKRARIPVVLLAQLSRPSQKGLYPRPTLDMFRDTGAIEALASVAMCVWREHEDGVPGENAELLVLANRHGRPGSYALKWDEAKLRFVLPAGEDGRPIVRPPRHEPREPGEDF